MVGHRTLSRRSGWFHSLRGRVSCASLPLKRLLCVPRKSKNERIEKEDGNDAGEVSTLVLNYKKRIFNLQLQQIKL